MDVVLHLGAHRSGSTSFQHYLRGARDPLEAQGVGFWGPWRTRKGLLNTLPDRPASPAKARRAQGKLRLNLERSARHGVKTLIVTDENLIGTPRANLRKRRLYPDIGERMARVHTSFGHVTRIALHIRSPEAWWASALAYLVARGLPVPGAETLERIATSTRGWQQVISDLACACPGTEVIVTLYERSAGAHDRHFRHMTGVTDVPRLPRDGIWTNRSPSLPQLRALLAERGDAPGLLGPGDGRWMPFTAAQMAMMRETYADDLFWLKSGAEGLARLTDDTLPGDIRKSGAAGLTERGHDNGSEGHADTGQLAPTR